MMRSGPTPDTTDLTGRPVFENRRAGLETWLSFVILAVLAGMLGIILRVQGTFNPAVELAIGLQLQTSDLQPPAAVSGALDMATPAELGPMGPAESFLPENLSDKIDGKAELYLKAGFIRLDTQRFRVASVPGAWIELSVYDMASPEAAFSVYSMQRRETGYALDGLPQSYATENAVFLHQGHVYLEIVASTASETVIELMDRLARQYIEAHPVTDSGEPADKDLFPETGLESNSIQLISANAFGNDALNDVLVATYRISGTELTGFVTRRSSPEEAARMKMDYGNFLTRFGAVPLDRPEALHGAAVYDLMGFFEIIFVTDHYMAGIHEAEDLSIAEQLALDMHQQIRQVVDERRSSR